VIGQPLRSRDVGQSLVEDRLDHGLAARHRIADHIEVGWKLVQLRGVVAFVQRDAEPAQLLAHGRIDLRVATGDRVAALARDLGQPAHESAADAEYVEVHVQRKMKYTAPIRHNAAQR
jgi:hypothetical protein